MISVAERAQIFVISQAAHIPVVDVRLQQLRRKQCHVQANMGYVSWVITERRSIELPGGITWHATLRLMAPISGEHAARTPKEGVRRNFNQPSSITRLVRV